MRSLSTLATLLVGSAIVFSAPIVKANMEIDAWTFVNDNNFCGDGTHTVPTGKQLTIDGGIGSSSGGCSVILEQEAAFEIRGGAELEFGTFFEVTNFGFDFCNPVDCPRKTEFKIEESSITVWGPGGAGSGLKIYLQGTRHTIKCSESTLSVVEVPASTSPGLSFFIEGTGRSFEKTAA